MDFREIGMRGGIETVGEETLDGVAAELARRQADRVQYYEGDFGARRTLVQLGDSNCAHAQLSDSHR